MHVLIDIADDEDAKAIHRIRAIALFGKYGGIDKLPLTDEEQLVAETLTKERIAELWEQLERVRTMEQFGKMRVAAAEGKAAVILRR